MDNDKGLLYKLKNGYVQKREALASLFLKS